MVAITPATEWYRYTNQDCDERQALLGDLQRDHRPYLRHPDSMVRSFADWTCEYFKFRSVRPDTKADNELAHKYLDLLYKRLREVGHKYAGPYFELLATVTEWREWADDNPNTPNRLLPTELAEKIDAAIDMTTA